MKPKAVLVSDQDDVILEGLIYGETEKTINCKQVSYDCFECEYCADCRYYTPNIESKMEILFDELESKLKSLTSDLIETIIDDDEEEEKEEIISILKNTKLSLPSLYETCTLLDKIREEVAINYKEEIHDFIDEYENIEVMKDEACDGGTEVLIERGGCRYYDETDFEEINEWKVSLPSHLWLKVTFKEFEDEPVYCLLALVEHEGFILAPLPIGNVYGHPIKNNGITLIGKVCWGELEPSSVLQVAYNQFWGSIFNEDLNQKDTWLNSEEFLEEINFKVKRNALCLDCRNNLLLSDGVFKDTVKLQLL